MKTADGEASPLHYHPMTTSHRKPWIRFALSLLALALIVGATGCKNNPADETWYCYDSQGHPVEGVIIICHYGLAGYDKTGVNCRVSDATGKVVLDLDDDTPRGLIRGFSCIYSPKLRNGDVDLGERWHEGQPVPDVPVYFDEWKKEIHLKDATEDPLMWHAALHYFIAGYSSSKGVRNGGKKLDAKLASLAFRERARFLEEYGEQVVPPSYLADGAFARSVSHDDRPKAGAKFKDITLPFPDQQWSSYDSNGRAVEGAILVYHSGLGDPDAIRYAEGDDRGRIILDPDEGMIKGVDRIFDCAYSPRLRCGGAGLGERWVYPQPIPKGPVYCQDRGNTVFFKNNTEDPIFKNHTENPVIWHAALEELINAYARSIKTAGGGARLDAKFLSLVTHERALFLEKYGEQAVPVDYIKTGPFRRFYHDLHDQNDAGLKFKDITLALPEL